MKSGSMNHQIRVVNNSHTGFPKYPSYPSSYSSSYNTRCSQNIDDLLVVLNFLFQFGYTFAFDALAVCIALPDGIYGSSFIAPTRKKTFTVYLYATAFLP